MQGCGIIKFYYLSTDIKMDKIHLSNHEFLPENWHLSYFSKKTYGVGTH